jgi:hypothetical protein
MLTTLVWGTMVTIDLKIGEKIRRQLTRTVGTKTGIAQK